MFFKSLIRVFFFTLLSSSVLFSSDYNFNYDVHSSCFNRSSEEKCYPFWYENADGSTNAFTNFVAALNYVGPIINITGIKIGNYFINKWENEITGAIEEQLAGIKDAESKVRILLSDVIQKFDNGIGESSDFALALGLVESLNRYKCDICINEFVSIVSNHFDSSLTLNIIDSDSDIDSDDERKLNRKSFHDFATKINQRIRTGACEDHEYRQIAHVPYPKKTIKNRIASAFCYKWTHPFHWSSLLYAASALTAPPVFSWFLDVNNRAGSLIGDGANISNVMVIPTLQAFNVFQAWRNFDRTKSQRLLDEIERRLENIDGIIEIASRVIGTMDNNISNNQAKGFLKTLILIGWPDEQVNQFMELASRKRTDFDTLIAAIKEQYRRKGIPYVDPYIEAAFDYAVTKEKITILEVASEDSQR